MFRNAPFFATILTTLALGACMKSEPVATVTDPTSGAQGADDEAAITEAPEAEEEKAAATTPTGGAELASTTSTREKPKEPATATGREKAESTLDFLGDSVADAAPPMEAQATGSPIVRPRPDAPAPRAEPGRLAAKKDMVGSGGAAVGYAPPPAKPYVSQPVMPVPTPIPDHLASNTEDYTDYGVNAFTVTATDGLSTFAIDVDTASYAIARMKLRQGYLPPQEAVRVEEFVNYFTYEYRAPKPSDPFSVDFEAAPSPWNPDHHVVRVGVQGKKVAFDQRQPVHLTFLVDTSGSMQSDAKIGLVKKTLKMLTEELEDGDTVAIATYAGNTSIALEPTPIANKKAILGALDRLTAGGSTAMGAGIDLAYRLADATYVDGSVNRVIVCSDGDANVGVTDPQQLTKLIGGYAQKGITLTTVGFGTGNYKDTMMERLANQGDGNYYYIDTESEARRVFSDKLTSTLEVIAKDVKIQVEWNPNAVEAYRLVGYENRDIADNDFRNDKVDAGEIGAGHQVTAIYEVILKDGTQGNLATVRVRNKAPGPESPAVERTFALPASAMKASFAESSDQFRVAFAAASFAEVLRGSPYLEGVTFKQIEQIARSAARPEYPEDAELVELVGTAARLRGEGAFTSR